ncbi:ABC transporter permease [Antribacter gilvus]|uniref:ABC transporter permease n=1 Tax=Antribacter gilvus TaxID=2304675 RepID=UPI000F78A5CA|nr:ABC transporter permease [Antribacter gilvus]
MLKFILRRVGASVLVLLGASVLMYILVINSGDPLADFRESNDPRAAAQMRSRIAAMGLENPWYERYWDWLKGVGGCFTGQCDLGNSVNGTSVLALTEQAAGSTLRLVTLATLLAIVLGVGLGILTAIRQYSAFDYTVTFGAFLFFALPVFWAAVLLKEFGAIRYNNWIAEGQYAPGTILVIAAVLALALAGLLGGSRRRRLLTGAATFVFVAAVMFVFNMIDWYRNPSFGLVMVVLTSAGAAVLVTALVSGLKNRKALYASLTTVAVGAVIYLVLAIAGVLAEPTWLLLAGLFVLALAISVGIGYFMGGYAKKQVMMITGITGTITSLMVVVDQLIAHWASFLGLKSRPISTIGAETPQFGGGFWESALDKGAQLLLPTLLLALISVATHSRYTRASMLEVMGQDYVRTARSKGLSEREVIVKHAFRNALIPITTIVAFDFAALIGGAVITERVFGWKGMGQLFQQGLNATDPNPVMAFFLVTGVAAVTMNLLADIAYASLDPRIRR